MRGRLVEYASLDWDEQGRGALVPRSMHFDDIYFSEYGLAETNHVFLKGNKLSTRFQTASRISIGELGFGSGLNFLATWKLWASTKKRDKAKLHFLSFEKYPVAPDDIIRIHQLWPDLAPFSQTLQTQYPPNIAGFHQLILDKDVTLTLFFGDVETGLDQLHSRITAIDAWFLDGFSPAKNSLMWADTLFPKIAERSSPGATFSTFTVAGHVRRNLQQVGFALEKSPGFGKKREMLQGFLRTPIKRERTTGQTSLRPFDDKTNTYNSPWYSLETLSPFPPGATIAIIGGGIAGASLAFALKRQGFTPVIYEALSPASGASGNKAGLIMPRLDRDNTPAARFSLHAWLYTVRLLTDLQRNRPSNKPALYNPCGAARLGRDPDQQALLRTLTEENLLPDNWINPLEEGVFFPKGGVVSPPDFVRTLLKNTPIRKSHIISFHEQDGKIHLKTNTGTIEIADAVILANGQQASRFLAARSLPLTGSIGQMEVYEKGIAPDYALTYGPYAAPLATGGGTGLVIGATYHSLHKDKAHTTEKAAQENMTRLEQFRPDMTKDLTVGDGVSRTSIRCMTPDQLPVVGPLPDWAFFAGAYDGLRQGRIESYPKAQYQPGIFMLSGLGSRGLVTAPLAAAMIASLLSGTPAPVPADVYECLHPGRFFIRTLKKTKQASPN